MNKARDRNMHTVEFFLVRVCVCFFSFFCDFETPHSSSRFSSLTRDRFFVLKLCACVCVDEQKKLKKKTDLKSFFQPQPIERMNEKKYYLIISLLGNRR